MKSLLLACMILVTCPAWAEWKLMSTDEEGNRNYIDPTTIRKNGNMRLVWRLANLAVKDKDGELSRRSRLEFDCIKERWRIISISAHSGPDASGVVLLLSTSDDTFPWNDVPPRTIVSAMLKYVCDR
jgi:hypothetical protein